MRSTLNKILGLLAFLLLINCGHSQQSMLYQAVLRDAGGVLISAQDIDVRISVAADLSGSVLLYQEDHSTTTNDYGMIELEFGTGVSTGAGSAPSLIAVDWSQQNFMNVQFKESSSATFIDLGTNALQTVPYALHALGSSQTYSMGDLTNVDTTGIQPGFTLVWNGSYWIASSIDSVQFAYTSDQSVLSDTATVALDCINCVSDSANYGSYSDTSAVSGSAGSSVYSSTSGYADTVGYAENSLNSWDLNGNVAGPTDFLGTTDSSDIRILTNGQERMVFKANGKIGIGLSDPELDLEINGQNGFAFSSGFGSGLSRTFTGDRMAWYPKKGHFYVGGGTGTLSDANMGNYSLGLGYNVYPRGDYSMATGYGTSVQGNYSFAGGYISDANGDYSFSFGYNSGASGDAAVSMGRQCAASGLSSIALGYHVSATGDHSVALGYYSNATDTSSYAMGYRARSYHKGSFVYADIGSWFESTAENQFLVRVKNGAKFYSASDLSTGVELVAGGGAWSTLSDSTKKENIVAVNNAEILAQLKSVPVYEWNYKSQHDSIVHIGPTAQDFRHTFGYGESDKMISTVDIDGVNMAALQALIQRQEELQRAYEGEIERLKKLNDNLLKEKEEVWIKVEHLEKLLLQVE